MVDRFYPSSKTCSSCGEKKSSLSLSLRLFKCDSLIVLPLIIVVNQFL
ncbi:MAG: zinc ribbon domain-containing protein [Cuspidothrix sp.]